MLVLAFDAKSGGLTGLSSLRLALAVGVGFCSFISLAAFFYFKAHPQVEAKAAAVVQGICAKPFIYASVFFLGLGLVVAGLQYALFSLAIDESADKAIFLRLLPGAAWLGFLALEVALFLPLFRYGRYALPGGVKSNLKAGAVILVLLLCLGLGMVLSGLGLRRDVIGWHDPGAPILPLWVTAAWIVGVLCAALGLAFRRRTWIFDICIGVLLWLAAVLLWQVQPVTPNYFLLRPGQPNYEYYPYSDAAALDIAAQQILIGEGYGAGALKPLYTTFLAGLHALAGQRYDEVANAQVLFLAVFPVFLFFLGVLLHQRLSGVMAAVLVILREAGAIALSGEIRVAHAKLLLSDLPTAVGLAAFTLLVTYWLAKKQAGRALPILAGGMLGFFVLLRPQMMAFVPLVFLFVIVFFARRPRLLLQACLWMALGLGLSLAGWLGRTWVKTGSLMVNDVWQTAYMSAVYNLSPDERDVFRSAVQPLAGESTDDYSRRIQTAVLDFIRMHPDVAAQFVTGHFLHNQADALLVLPVTFSSVYAPDGAADWLITGRRKAVRVWQDCCSPSAYVNSQSFWQNWDGAFPATAILPLLLGLVFISLGVGSVWKKMGWAGLFPLWVEVIYALSSAVGRQSGWRFILPVDWVVVLYFAIGLGQATQWAAGVVFQPALSPENTSSAIFPNRHYGWLAALLFVFLAGGTFPLVEALVPRRFTPQYEQSLDLAAQAQQGKLTETLEIDALDDARLEQAGLLRISGRALYPRFYRRGEGEMSTGSAAYFPRPFDRLAFILINDQIVQAVLPAEDAPDVFPHAADVQVIGCMRERYFEAWAVILPGAAPQVIRRSPGDAEACGSGS